MAWPCLCCWLSIGLENPADCTNLLEVSAPFLHLLGCNSTRFPNRLCNGTYLIEADQSPIQTQVNLRSWTRNTNNVLKSACHSSPHFCKALRQAGAACSHHMQFSERHNGIVCKTSNMKIRKSAGPNIRGKIMK